MSNSVQLLKGTYKPNERRSLTKNRKMNNRHSSISQIQKISKNGVKISKKREEEISRPHNRNYSEDNIIKHTAKTILFSSLDDDIAKLENVSSKNNFVRKNLLKVQEAVMFMKFSENLSPIKESDEAVSNFSHQESSINPLDLLVDKYNAKQVKQDP